MLCSDWSFYDDTIKYLNNDLDCLHQVLIKANKQIFIDYNANMTDCITISGLAVRIYLKDFYNNNIPNINKGSIYKDIKQGYYGGITEVYKPSDNNLYYYDVNSLYPYVALQDMPALSCSKINYYDEPEDISNLFGFFYCNISTPLDSYIGILPVRTAKGLIFPLGKWDGWYFSEQLKFAKQQGYTIKVLKGYNFSREKDVFTKYIDKIYKIKSLPVNKSQKAVSKSLLNNLLGRFGINMENEVYKIVINATHERMMCMYKIKSYKKITENKVLVMYQVWIINLLQIMV